jgi:hypothetical protein
VLAFYPSRFIKVMWCKNSTNIKYSSRRDNFSKKHRFLYSQNLGENVYAFNLENLSRRNSTRGFIIQNLLKDSTSLTALEANTEFSKCSTKNQICLCLAKAQGPTLKHTMPGLSRSCARSRLSAGSLDKPNISCVYRQIAKGSEL